MATAITVVCDTVDVQRCTKCCGGDDVFSHSTVLGSRVAEESHRRRAQKRRWSEKPYMPLFFILKRQKCLCFLAVYSYCFQPFEPLRVLTSVIYPLLFHDLSSPKLLPLLCSMRPLLPCNSDAAGADSGATFSLLFSAWPDLFFSPRLCCSGLTALLSSI